jgi:hypothetical protein
MGTLIHGLCFWMNNYFVLQVVLFWTPDWFDPRFGHNSRKGKCTYISDICTLSAKLTNYSFEKVYVHFWKSVRVSGYTRTLRTKATMATRPEEWYIAEKHCHVLWLYTWLIYYDYHPTGVAGSNYSRVRSRGRGWFECYTCATKLCLHSLLYCIFQNYNYCNVGYSVLHLPVCIEGETVTGDP